MKKPESELQRLIIHGLVMLAVFILQSAPGALPRVFGVSPLPLIPLAVIIAMYEGDTGGAVFGLAAGLLIDVNAVHTAGFAALVLMLVGCVCGLLVIHLMRNTVLTCLTLSAGASLFYCLLHWLIFYLIPGKEEPLRYLLHYSLVRAVYTAALCVPLYLLMRRLTRKKRRKRYAG